MRQIIIEAIRPAIEKGWPPTQICREAGLSRAFIEMALRRGKAKPKSVEKLVRASSALAKTAYSPPRNAHNKTRDSKGVGWSIYHKAP